MIFDSLHTLVDAVREGHPRAVSRMISLVENQSHLLRPAMEALAPYTGRAHVVGITGAPGVGKSTITNGLVAALRGGGQRVGVLAVDPSSPFTGGALLGDRVRMQEHALDDDVLIRSMASRGHLGGLSVAAPLALRVFDAAGCATVLVETVGVGQSEVEVAGTADTTLMLLAPGMGDGIQAAKAGILEIGDIFVVNKSDRDGAQALVRDLRTMISLAVRDPGEWKPPIVSTVAVRVEGLSEVLAAVQEHAETAQRSGAWDTRRLRRARNEVESLALASLRDGLRVSGDSGLDEVSVQVCRGELDPFTAADRVVAGTLH